MSKQHCRSNWQRCCLLLRHCWRFSNKHEASFDLTETTFHSVEKKRNFNSKLVRHCCRLWQQSRTLLLHCCWCGPCFRRGQRENQIQRDEVSDHSRVRRSGLLHNRRLHHTARSWRYIFRCHTGTRSAHTAIDSLTHKWHTHVAAETISLCSVGCVAQWLERWSLAGELSLSYPPPAAGWPLMWVNRPLHGQPTRPTQPFILSGSINWVVSYFIGRVLVAPSGECSPG